MVHSSLSSMKLVPGGPETVIRGFLKALGERGALLLPALSYRYVHAMNPVFDVLRTPSNIGRIPEYFRTRPGTMRSVNPTHSVSGVGPVADSMLREHDLDETPCGPHSPFRLLRDRGGQVIFLGCGLAPNTSMHAVEELVNPPYLFGDMIEYRIVMPDGTERKARCRRHNFVGFAQRYERIGPLMKDGGLLVGQVLAATVHVLEAPAMWERALEAYGRDPLYFVDRL